MYTLRAKPAQYGLLPFRRPGGLQFASSGWHAARFS